MMTHPTPRPPHRALNLNLKTILALSMAWALLAGPARSAEPPDGKAIYFEQCASCHGQAGEGTAEYTQALIGDRSVQQLSRYITKRMPEDEPELCEGEDADAVARYIYDTFYSSVAQARLKPPRIELSRLTVRQHRNALIDLIGAFRGPVKWEGPKGLSGEYSNSHQFWKKENRIIDRVDPTVDFDFGVNLPDSDEVGNLFYIRWQGGLLAPETGDYEFVVRSEHSIRLWVNDQKDALIDRWVISGDDTEFKGSIYLIGGRVYPIRLEMSKGKKGVDDSKKNPPKPTKASIALLWKQPRRALEVIPDRNLSPANTPELFVPTTPFPPDDQSMGYERGSSVSREWDAAATDVAIETANYVTERLEELAKVKPDAADREAKLREFAARFVETALRRPLTDDQRAVLIDRQFEAGPDLDASIKRVVLLTLKSPWFLYTELAGTLDDYDVASRLSLGLWDSLPDATLLQAAAKGELKKPEQVKAQAERMVGDLRTHFKIREFLTRWLRIDPARARDMGKDPSLFPKFDEAVAADLHTSLEMFLDDVLRSDGGSLHDLLTSDTVFLNGRLAAVYGADLPADAPFQKVKLKDEPRAGVVTHPLVLSNYAYSEFSSPIHRGVWLSRSVLGRFLMPPPEASAPFAADAHPGMTTRERAALQTSSHACMVCHEMINPLGFALENFDAIGRFRTEELNKPIDATGGYESVDGQEVAFKGPLDLTNFLASSNEVSTAFAEQLFHYLVKQPINAFGLGELPALARTFQEKDQNIRELAVDIMAASALTPRASSVAKGEAATAAVQQ